MEQLYIADVAEVTFEDKKTDNVMFTGTAQVSGVSGESESEKIFGGIGNKHLYTIRHSKELTLNITDATFDLEFLAMTQGNSVKNDKVTVVEYEQALKVDSGSVTLKDSDYSGSVLLKGDNGKSEKLEASSGTVEVPEGFAGDSNEVDVAYNKEVEGQTVIMDATQFSNNFRVVYKTIVYSTETNEVVADLYFVFPNASPSDEFEISLENGEAYTPELEFDAMSESNSDELGRIVQVPRKKKEDNDDGDGDGEETP